MKNIKREISIAIILVLLTFMFACTPQTDIPSQTSSSDCPPVTEPTQTEPTEPVKNYEDGTVTILIYLCGSNLESKRGAATKNIAEMLTVDLPESVRVIIQTGGAKAWRNYDIPSDKSCRYEIKDKTLTLLEENSILNMGLSSTLSDFIIWGAEEAPAEKIAIILWDHGGGSLGGLCLDEQFGKEALTLPELNTALATAHGVLKRDFAWVGFDACLMATLDTANIVSRYADYMIASEEVEPSGGWDYAAFLSGLAADPTQDTVCLGKLICDSYKAKCDVSGKGRFMTLSLIDLAGIPSAVTAFDAFAKEISDGLSESAGLKYLYSALEASVNFGGSSDVEGYSNLFDLTNLADKLVFDYEYAAYLYSALFNAIPYSVCGDGRKNACGISVYYPKNYDDTEANKYLSVCEFENYKTYLQNFYISKPDQTIEFKDSGSIAEDGSFQIVISDQSTSYIESVNYYLLEFGQRSELEIYGLGEDNDIFCSLDKTRYGSNFRGVWLALDGKRLNYKPIDKTDTYTIFTAPILLNGVRTNLRFAYFWDDYFENGGYYTTFGTWSGMDENGFSDRDIHPLVLGDKVTVLYNQINEGDYSLSLAEGDTFTIGEDGGRITEIPLAEQNYQYVFRIVDIYGNVFYSSTAVFKMKYTYEQLLNHPLPDGEYAADVVVISDTVDNELAYGR